MNYKKLMTSIVVTTVTNFAIADQSNFTVDQADSPNQVKFFQDTKNQEAFIKEDFKNPWDPTDQKAVNAFPTENKGVVTYSGDAKQTAGNTTQAAPVIAKPGDTFDKGQRINIREMYKLTGSPSAADAGNALQAQMASFCPKGFAKHGEWVKPIEGTKNFYLYYQFECIDL